MSDEIELKENQFKLENGDICESKDGSVVNLSDIQRQQSTKKKKKKQKATK